MRFGGFFFFVPAGVWGLGFVSLVWVWGLGFVNVVWFNRKC
jgi:hypothetical protein